MDAEAQTNAPGLRFGFDNTYARLPEHFYARLNPKPVAAPRLVELNRSLAAFLNLDAEALGGAEGVELLSGNRVAEGAEPLAIAYAGHQFGYFVPQLGDGRANLLGEVRAQDGKRYDIQLKGSGPTPFSRRGDGRAALGPVLREYLVSEAMAALGVPTTRALAALTTGERVLRDAALPGGVFVRVAASHLRVGTFQYFAARNDEGALQQLAEYAIARHYPELAESRARYGALLRAVVQRHARLVAQWMLLGFVHGVMNTDNTSISGETLDYGPCAFLEAYDPGAVFSSIDVNGRYAFGSQPAAAHWNLVRLAEALVPLLMKEAGGEEAAVYAAREALDAFEPEFLAARSAGLRKKLGLATAQDGDAELSDSLLACMETGKADYTLTFRRLCDAAVSAAFDAEVRKLFTRPAAFDEWAATWRRRLHAEEWSSEERRSSMRATNPMFIPRNHLVEAAIQAAVSSEDYSPFRDLLAVVSRPYEHGEGLERFSKPASPEELVTQTFCGT